MQQHQLLRGSGDVQEPRAAQGRRVAGQHDHQRAHTSAAADADDADHAEADAAAADFGTNARARYERADTLPAGRANAAAYSYGSVCVRAVPVCDDAMCYRARARVCVQR
jgi:hypothetical protein